MTVWFTSDTHFGHARIIELSDRKFVDIEQHNEALVANWNSLVGIDDTVWHLGDVNLGSFTESIEYARRLNGYKLLIVGNHDRLFIDPDAKNIEKAKRYRDRFLPVYEEVFSGVSLGDETRAAQDVIPLYNGAVVRLSHFPYGESDSHESPRFAGIRPMDDGTILIHGHTHSTRKISRSAKGTLMIHVGVDAHNYFPVSEDEIVDIVNANR
jgi:calcineurin-like phosphoesterase family protein